MSRRNWTAERIARLSYLVGRGWAPERIAADPIVRSTEPNVRRQAARFGLSFQEARGSIRFQIPQDLLERLVMCAAPRMITVDQLCRLYVLEGAKDPTLIENVLDDREGLPA